MQRRPPHTGADLGLHQKEDFPARGILMELPAIGGPRLRLELGMRHAITYKR
jgi:hypothetical protein